MSEKSDLSMLTAGVFLDIIRRVTKSNIRISGKENITNKPTVFVINHFTRAETFLVPYLIHRSTGKLAKSLGHKSLFKGVLGKILPKLGVVSTAEEDRNERIVRDLMTGDSNWTVYPEGMMVKSKKVIKKGNYIITTPNRTGPPHTGAALLAIQAQMYKKDYLKAIADHDDDTIERINKKFNIASHKDICKDDIQIVPVTITYHPLRPGNNVVKRLTEHFVDDLPDEFLEELEIEGNIFLKNTDISVHFNEAINVEDYCDDFLINCLDLNKSSFLLKRRTSNLTNDFMYKIYSNVDINFDHLFCYALKKCKKSRVKKIDFHRSLFNSYSELKGSFRMNEKSLNDSIHTVMLDGHRSEIAKLAMDMGFIREEGEHYVINKIKLNAVYLFHKIRVRNPIIVIANELETAKKAAKIVERNVNLHYITTRNRARGNLLQLDLDILKEEHEGYDSSAKPFILINTETSKGVVLSHGFLSCPKEMEHMAYKFFEAGYSVYVTRLPGHGTSPEKVKDVSYEDWVNSYKMGISILSCYCDDITLGGFSTGGILAIWCASNYNSVIKYCFAINPPIFLKDVKTRMVGAANLWNDLLEKFNINSKIEFVKTVPEHPNNNYDKIYVKGLKQLDLLMNDCKSLLRNVTVPSLIAVSSNDPTVNPDSSYYLKNNMVNSNCFLMEFNSDKHVIVSDWEVVRKIVDKVTDR
jgi:esterase/lipase/1-acyl-sn-glycerol-3-phosphate acyltransferase